MSNPGSRSGLTRRQFVGLLAASGVTLVGGYALYEYTPWLDYEAKAVQVRTPLSALPAGSARMNTLVLAATLAASSHNTQPWKFEVSQEAVTIRPDFTRQLKILDPKGRELWISLGCALENLLVAAHAVGYATQVIYPETVEEIRVQFTVDSPHSGSLFAAVSQRQNTRSLYDARPVQQSILRTLQAVSSEPGVSVKFVLEPSELKTVLAYINQGNLKQYADPVFVQELIHWLRFTKKDALASLDGLYTRSSGNPEVPRWLGEMVVGATNPQSQADADAAKFRSSSGAVVISSASDDRAAWVRSGQVYEQLALQMTVLGVQSAFLNQPIEVDSVREQLQSALALGSDVPQLLMRFGHAPAMPASLRRPVEQVLTTV